MNPLPCFASIWDEVRTLNRIKQNKPGIILFVLILLLWGAYQQYILMDSSLEYIKTSPVSSEESTHSMPVASQWSVADLFYQTTGINQVRPSESLLHLLRNRSVQPCFGLYNAISSDIYQINLLFIWIFILSLPLLYILKIISYIHHQDGEKSLSLSVDAQRLCL